MLGRRVIIVVIVTAEAYNTFFLRAAIIVEPCNTMMVNVIKQTRDSINIYCILGYLSLKWLFFDSLA